MIKVLIADDHPIYRHGLKMLLHTENCIKVVGECSNGVEVIDAARQWSPDVILMDIRMPLVNGIEASRRIMEHNPDTKIVVLTSTSNETQIMEMLRAGVKGYLLKNYAPTEVVVAIKKAHEGEEYFCREAVVVILQHFSKANPELKLLFNTHDFADKELQIIRYICQQKTAREISELLFLSEKTVDFHRQKIIEKMGVKNIIGLVVYAIKNKLVEIEEIL